MQVQRLFVDVHVQSARPSPVSVLPVVQNLDRFHLVPETGQVLQVQRNETPFRGDDHTGQTQRVAGGRGVAVERGAEEVEDGVGVEGGGQTHEANEDGVEQVAFVLHAVVRVEAAFFDIAHPVARAVTDPQKRTPLVAPILR